MNSQGSKFLDEGDLSTASFNISIFSGSMGLSVYFRMLLRALKKDFSFSPNENYSEQRPPGRPASKLLGLGRGPV